LAAQNHHASDEDRLIQENQELNKSISELTHELTTIELNKEKKKQKIVKIMSALTYFSVGEHLDSETAL
jgi:hypothetical protein